MQSDNPFLDDLARIATGAAGAFQGMRDEARTAARAMAERWISEFDLVTRAELDAVKAVAGEALARVEALEARLAAIETEKSAVTGSPQKDT